ncbi:hypothetical protein C1T17_00830 [Sphingobium sp. SCG-1]|uniref:hypothetical protein n=1 Tax=Sphingobium sp. SCG-1 TaxID=2072936 RepID=UPI000CD68113|nr:hypothetical protein C1T17_00830 [Sphingobium sp. SCG-1]
MMMTTAPAFGQDAAAPAAPAAPAGTAPAAGQMSQAQVAAFNQAVTDFTAGQTAQQGGDNAGALAKYEAALPAIRTAVQTQPANIDNVNFLANALYAAAAAAGAQQQLDKTLAYYDESVPHWRKVVAAKPTDATSRNILAGILVQSGNAKLTKQDKAGAAPLYAEALTLARKSATEQAADPIAKNLLLSALIGSSQTSDDPKVKEEAVTMSKAMLADGSVDAVNKPSAQALSGAPAAAPAK